MIAELAEIAFVGILILMGLPAGFAMFAAWGAVVFAEPLSTPIEEPEHNAISELERRLGEETEPLTDGGER